MNSSVKSTHSYLEKVLGLNSLIVPEGTELGQVLGQSLIGENTGETDDPQLENQSIELSTLSQGSSPITFLSVLVNGEASLGSGPAFEMLQKMHSAMGYSPAELNLVEAALPSTAESWMDLIQRCQASFGVLFVSQESYLPQLFGQIGVIERVAGAQWIATAHPNRLLQQQNLKRAVWQHLQGLMGQIKN